MLNQTELSIALGLTRQRISILVKEGMPLESLEAAKAWRAARVSVQRARAPQPAPAQLDDGTLADTIQQHRALVGRARGVWQAAMEQGDPNGPKYQTSYNQSLKTLVALEEQQERRLIMAKDYISSKEATDAMRELASGVVNRLNKLAFDVAEACNPENPAKAVKVLEAWARRVKSELSTDDEQE
jgi:hypothetical protein